VILSAWHLRPRLLLTLLGGARTIWDSIGAVGRIGRGHITRGVGPVVAWIRLSGFKCLLQCPAALLSFCFALVSLSEPAPKLGDFAQKMIALLLELRIPPLGFSQVVVGSFPFVVPRSLQLARTRREVTQYGFTLSEFFF
jgi:hypothetical protein